MTEEDQGKEPEKRRLGLSLKQINQENSENMVEPNEDVQDNEVSDEIVSSTELEVDADSNVDEVISSDLTEDSKNEESVDEETGEETEENEDSI